MFVCVSEMQMTRILGLLRGGLKAGPRNQRRMKYRVEMRARNGDSRILSRRVGGSHTFALRDQNGITPMGWNRTCGIGVAFIVSAPMGVEVKMPQDCH